MRSMCSVILVRDVLHTDNDSLSLKCRCCASKERNQRIWRERERKNTSSLIVASCRLWYVSLSLRFDLIVCVCVSV